MNTQNVFILLNKNLNFIDVILRCYIDVTVKCLYYLILISLEWKKIEGTFHIAQLGISFFGKNDLCQWSCCMYTLYYLLTICSELFVHEITGYSLFLVKFV